MIMTVSWCMIMYDGIYNQIFNDLLWPDIVVMHILAVRKCFLFIYCLTYYILSSAPVVGYDVHAGTTYHLTQTPVGVRLSQHTDQTETSCETRGTDQSLSRYDSRV